ncbi:hypothetical protein [Pedobacter sp. KACC 23697]|uniref:Uncharacterized protein n=1 Tax=Pedobacter sp. KACC 23697 TaxID=3149230 RepID=A0AAU7KA06_9SPHI
MFWNSAENTHKKIQISRCFNERYLVTQTSEIVMSSLVVKTITEFRWDVRVLKITDEGYQIELLSLDNVLKESNNPNMRDLNAFNNAFKRMYSELNMLVGKDGQLIEVKNISEIQRKWSQVKSEMEAIQTRHDNMKGIIALNDELFNNPDNIKAAVKGNEFFEVFFNAYLGLSLPGGKNIRKKSLFAQENISWSYAVTTENPLSPMGGKANISIVGHATENFDQAWIKNAYGSFPITEIAGHKPQVRDEASYQIDYRSGRVLNGLVTKEEVVHPEFLKAKMIYEIMADNQEVEQEPNPVKDTERTPEETHEKGRFSLLD